MWAGEGGEMWMCRGLALSCTLRGGWEAHHSPPWVDAYWSGRIFGQPAQQRGDHGQGPLSGLVRSRSRMRRRAQGTDRANASPSGCCSASQEPPLVPGDHP